MKTIGEKNPKGTNKITLSKVAIDKPSSKRLKEIWASPLNIEVVLKSPPIIPVIFKIAKTVRIHANSHKSFIGLNSNFLFTTINPRKIDLKMSTEEARRIIRATFRKENIKGYWKGTHALRRTAASNLFNNTNSFKIVSDILGHESIDSTTSYVRVDFELLRSITSPWPGYGGEVHD